MKKILMLISVCVVLSCQNTSSTKQHDHNETTETKKKPLSPLTSTMLMLNDAHIHIEYSAPSVRNRLIFGGLLAFDEVWQAGAHNATWIETNKKLKIADQELEVGKYGIFVIPRNTEDWTVILNSRWKQHGKDEYDANEDIIRLNVTPVSEAEFTEKLTYSIEQLDHATGMISLRWEKYHIQFPFEVID